MDAEIYFRTTETQQGGRSRQFNDQYIVSEPFVSISKPFFKNKKVKTISIYDENNLLVLNKIIELDTAEYFVIFKNYESHNCSLKIKEYYVKETLMRIDSLFYFTLKRKDETNCYISLSKMYKNGSLLNKEYNFYNEKYLNVLFEKKDQWIIDLSNVILVGQDKILFLSKNLKADYKQDVFYHCDSRLTKGYSINPDESTNEVIKYLRSEKLLKKDITKIKNAIGNPIKLPPFSEPIFWLRGNSTAHCGGSRGHRGYQFNQEPSIKRNVSTANPKGMNDTTFLEYYPLNTEKVIRKPTHTNCEHYLKGWSCTPVRRAILIYKYTYFAE
jgi:hypothetical protein